MKHEFLDWDALDTYHVYAISDIEKDGFEPDVIVPIVRGGLPFGVEMSHHFKCPLIPAMYQTRDGETDYLAETIIMLIERDPETGQTKYKRPLIVDDICDSGETIKKVSSHVRAFFRDFRVAVAISDERHLTEKYLDKNLVDYAGRNINRSTDKQWFVFPWEDQ